MFAPCAGRFALGKRSVLCLFSVGHAVSNIDLLVSRLPRRGVVDRRLSVRDQEFDAASDAYGRDTYDNVHLALEHLKAASPAGDEAFAILKTMGDP